MSTDAHASDYRTDAGITDPSDTPVAAVPVPPDHARAEEALLLLARAVQQFHTYPPTSPLCLSAVEACLRGLASLDLREEIEFRITPHEVILDEVPTGRGGAIEQELARRLHQAGVAQVTIERAASAREVTRFCLDLIDAADARFRHLPLVERLVDHGVSRIALRTAYRPEVMAVAQPTAPMCALLDAQRTQRTEALASGGPVNHLYAPDRGWIRMDPGASLPSVSLLDLALLVDDPGVLATMLLRLTDGDASASCTPSDALSQKFSEVTTLFEALDPRLTRVMFSRLARAVLDLDPERRQALLQRTILPGLLDGRAEGHVLREFPDVELADSLTLLLDLETAAPEVVSAALSRLDLSAERKAAVVPLLEQRMEVRERERAHSSLDAYARKLTNVDPARAKSVAELSSFDLALDDPTREGLARTCEAIAATHVIETQLGCLLSLMRLEPNPEVAAPIAHGAVDLMTELERESDWDRFAACAAKLGALVATLVESRPDVAGVLSHALGTLATPERAAQLVELAARDAAGRQAADAVITAIGAPLGPALAAAATHGTDGAREALTRAAHQLLTDHASLVAPSLAPLLPSATPTTARAILRVLGLAGAGYEAAVAGQLASADEQTVREALRSLARIGTPQAAALVRSVVERASGWLASAAAETLWHFPGTESRRQVLDLLGRREFVMRLPAVAERLLDRAAQGGGDGLAPVLDTLMPLRFRVWSPSLARVGRRAVALRTS